jgi:Skp family chaperone for outer membrane proteins
MKKLENEQQREELEKIRKLQAETREMLSRQPDAAMRQAEATTDLMKSILRLLPKEDKQN